MIFLRCRVFVSVCFVFVMHLISCHHVHFICIHVSLMHPSLFPVVRFAFRRFILLRWLFLPFFRVGIKHFRIGPRLAKQPWFTTGRPPVKFRTIWTSLILQRLTEGPKRPRVCCRQQPSKVAQNPPKPLPLSRSFDHDRVAENHTSFGAS